LNLFGYDIYDSDQNKLIEEIFDPHQITNQKIIFAINPNKVMMGIEDESIHQTLLKADYLIPDGYGIIYAAKRRNISLSRITGIDLMLDLCRNAVIHKKSIFLYGAGEESVSKTKIELERRFEGIRIVGYCNGYCKNNDELVDTINQSGAEILFVALGSMKQENWMVANKDKLNDIKILQGVGGSFDVISGQLKRAPNFFIALHLEWLYRILLEPKRIGYFKTMVKYLMYAAKTK